MKKWVYKTDIPASERDTTERNRRRRTRRAAQNRLKEILKAEGQAAHEAPQKRRQANREREAERHRIILRSLIIRLARELYGPYWQDTLRDKVPSADSILTDLRSTAAELEEKSAEVCSKRRENEAI